MAEQDKETYTAAEKCFLHHHSKAAPAFLVTSSSANGATFLPTVLHRACAMLHVQFMVMILSTVVQFETSAIIIGSFPFTRFGKPSSNLRSHTYSTLSLTLSLSTPSLSLSLFLPSFPLPFLFPDHFSNYHHHHHHRQQDKEQGAL